MMRGLIAIVAGLVVLTMLTFAIEGATTPVLMRLFPEALPTRASMQANLGVKLFILLYSTASMIAAGFVTAWIARRHQSRHAIAMATLQIALTGWAMYTFYDHAPWWAWVAGMALMIPAAWFGARLRTGSSAGQVIAAGR